MDLTAEMRGWTWYFHRLGDVWRTARRVRCPGYERGGSGGLAASAADSTMDLGLTASALCLPEGLRESFG